MDLTESKRKQRSQSNQRSDNKGLTRNNNTLLFKTTQDDDDTNFYTSLSKCIKKRKHHKTSSLSQTKHESNTSTHYKDEDSCPKPKQYNIKSLITILKTNVSDKMKNDIKDKQAKFKKRAMSVKELKDNVTKLYYLHDNKVQTDYNTIQEAAKRFYQHTVIKKEDAVMRSEYSEIMKDNDMIKKEIEMTQSKTNEMRDNTKYLKKKLRIASINCKKISIKVSEAIEEKKNLIRSILIINDRITMLKDMRSKQQRSECNIGEQLTELINTYSSSQ